MDSWGSDMPTPPSLPHRVNGGVVCNTGHLWDEKGHSITPHSQAGSPAYSTGPPAFDPFQPPPPPPPPLTRAILSANPSTITSFNFYPLIVLTGTGFVDGDFGASLSFVIGCGLLAGESQSIESVDFVSSTTIHLINCTIGSIPPGTYDICLDDGAPEELVGINVITVIP